MHFPRARKIVFKPFLIVGGIIAISIVNGRNRRIRARRKGDRINVNHSIHNSKQYYSNAFKGKREKRARGKRKTRTRKKAKKK